MTNPSWALSCALARPVASRASRPTTTSCTSWRPCLASRWGFWAERQSQGRAGCLPPAAWMVGCTARSQQAAWSLDFLQCCPCLEVGSLSCSGRAETLPPHASWHQQAYCHVTILLEAGICPEEEPVASRPRQPGPLPHASHKQAQHCT